MFAVLCHDNMHRKCQGKSLACKPELVYLYNENHCSSQTPFNAVNLYIFIVSALVLVRIASGLGSRVARAVDDARVALGRVRNIAGRRRNGRVSNASTASGERGLRTFGRGRWLDCRVRRLGLVRRGWLRRYDSGVASWGQGHGDGFRRSGLSDSVCLGDV